MKAFCLVIMKRNGAGRAGKSPLYLSLTLLFKTLFLRTSSEIRFYSEGWSLPCGSQQQGRGARVPLHNIQQPCPGREAAEHLVSS